MDVVKQALIILKMIEINITENNNRLIMNESDDPRISYKNSYLTQHFLRWDGIGSESEHFEEHYLKRRELAWTTLTSLFEEEVNNIISEYPTIMIHNNESIKRDIDNLTFFCRNILWGTKGLDDSSANIICNSINELLNDGEIKNNGYKIFTESLKIERR